jgi:hypothetical protein
MGSKLTSLRARTVEVASKLGAGQLQRMLSDGTVSSVNRDSLTRMIGKTRGELAYNSSKANDPTSVKHELTVYRHAQPQGENVAQVYSSGPARENGPQQYSGGTVRETSQQRYTEMIEVPPTEAAVAERLAAYAQQAARAQIALGTLVEVKDAVVAQLAEQSVLVSAWESIKDAGSAD